VVCRYGKTISTRRFCGSRTPSAVGSRLVLGIGLSHRATIEGTYGMSYDRPARHMREYLDALVPLLHDLQA